MFTYPASGCRHNGSGALANVSSGGYTWSSTAYAASPIHGAYIDFDKLHINPEEANVRAYGFPVRCVKE